MDIALRRAFTTILRDPREAASACREGRWPKALPRAALVFFVVGAAVFGGALGTFRGGSQIAFAAIKTPLALLITLALCVPALAVLGRSTGLKTPLSGWVVLALAAGGRFSLVLIATAPVLWLLIDLGVRYHIIAMVAAAAYVTAASAALGILARGFGGEERGAMAAIAFGCLFFAAGGQVAWTLRPYLVRPRATEVAFVRDIEGSFAEALLTAGRSSAGVYERSAPLPDADRREGTVPLPPAEPVHTPFELELEVRGLDGGRDGHR